MLENRQTMKYATVRPGPLPAARVLEAEFNRGPLLVLRLLQVSE